MTSYTPRTEQIETLVLGQLKQSAEKRGLPVNTQKDWADFRRWLSQVRREAKAAGWDEGYWQGVEDERTSASNIGIAGFGAKVQPNRVNPYRADQMEGDND